MQFFQEYKFKKHSKANNMYQWEEDEEVQRLTDVQELNKQKLNSRNSQDNLEEDASSLSHSKIDEIPITKENDLSQPSELISII